MTITILQESYWEMVAETVKHELFSHGADAFDKTYTYPQQFGQGYYREIELRAGLTLAIADYQLHDHLRINTVNRTHPLEYTFLLSGETKATQQTSKAGNYNLCGSGMAPGEQYEEAADQRILRLDVHLEPELFCQWMGQELPQALQPLLRPSDQIYYTRDGITTAAMQTAVHQILNCPYQGLTKRVYLASKVWELMALQLDTLMLTSNPQDSKSLRPEDIERIHYAKEVLISRLSNPPSLIELARLVGINDCKLKAGFRQVFDTTVFGCLHQLRMERSRQLLEAGEISVADAAQAVGFMNRSHFAIAFRKKFGINPSTYRKSQQRSWWVG